jgi:hypothetical protein
VYPTKHEEITPVVHKDIHQHHYHITVQPLTETVTLPTKHSYRRLPTQERVFDHGGDAPLSQSSQEQQTL